MQKRQHEKEEGRKEGKTGKKSVFHCQGAWASFKRLMFWGGGDNESTTPFQDNRILLIVQTEERREKEAESVLLEPMLKQNKPGFFLAMCWSNYVQAL